MSRSRVRRSAFSLLVSLSLIIGVAPLASAAGPTLPFPDTMAAVGDSITQAASSAGALGADAPQNSWSTGTSSSVNSHYSRLLAIGAPISGRNYNRSVSGAKVADLPGQMALAAALKPDYLTVLIGGNDLCTDTVAQMTSVTDFHDRFAAAMATIDAQSPETRVFVVSIPNVYQLWQLFKGNFWARFIWSAAGICQSLLANPTSTQAADVQRRDTVRLRNVAFNSQLQAVCSQFDQCLFDNNAVFNTPFTTSDVSGDYFHPSVAGQAKLAATTWNASYTFTAAPPPPPPNQAPKAAFTTSCSDLNCTFTSLSTDDVGVVSHAWTFGDAGTSTAVNPTHSYGAASTYTVTLTVKDAAGLTGSASQQITVTAQPSAGIVTVANFEAVGASTGKNTWTATATATVTDSDGRAPSGAVVSIGWDSGSATCTTTAGICSVTTESLNKRKLAEVAFRVTDVSLAGFTYDDGGVTTATATRP